jgi:hypothetical protein
MLEQRRIICRDLARTWVRRFQERIARAERAFVSAQGRPVKRIDLGREKIEIAAPRFRAAAHQFDVGIGERDHAAQAQVFIERALLDMIERNLPAQRAEAKF